jgi:hypothetical protein
MTRTPKLTDTHILLLSAASQRDDGLLDLSARLKGSALKATAEKLLNSGLAEEVPADLDQPSWRSDEMENRVGLRITATGLHAIGIEPDGEEPEQPATTDPGSETPAGGQSVSSVPSEKKQPRTGSKKALVISLLEREEGATLEELMGSTGWLPHTTRAALTGIRHSGHTLEKSRNTDGRAVYRIKPQSDEGMAPQTLADAA